MSEQIRWKQRFENFQKSYEFLKKFSVSQFPSEMERAARIQSFEVCFELSWKVLRDYFFEGGQILNSPREVLKQAVQANIVQDSRAWFSALESRNKTTHTYDEAMAEEISEDIYEEYLDIFQDFEQFFLAKL